MLERFTGNSSNWGNKSYLVQGLSWNHSHTWKPTQNPHDPNGYLSPVRQDRHPPQPPQWMWWRVPDVELDTTTSTVITKDRPKTNPGRLVLTPHTKCKTPETPTCRFMDTRQFYYVPSATETNAIPPRLPWLPATSEMEVLQDGQQA